MSIGNKIKERRESLGLTQTELAKRMGYSSKAAISKVETGKDNMALDRVTKFAQALNCSESYLMGWEDINGEEIIAKAQADAIRQKKLDKLTESELQLVDNLIDTLVASHNK